jgi:hypothetical protein
MTTQPTTRRQGRPRGQRIEIWVTPEEQEEIAALANRAGLSLSAYARAAALNHRVRSVYDLDAVADLVRVNGDLGRVAGLLKLWLVEKPGQGASRPDVNRMMDEFRAMQAELSRIMGKAVK